MHYRLSWGGGAGIGPGWSFAGFLGNRPSPAWAPIQLIDSDWSRVSWTPKYPGTV